MGVVSCVNPQTFVFHNEEVTISSWTCRVAISHLSNKMTNQIRVQNVKYPQIPKIVSCKSRQIEKLEAECSMLHELVLDPTRSSTI
jgi:hypothetical protein